MIGRFSETPVVGHSFEDATSSHMGGSVLDTASVHIEKEMTDRSVGERGVV